jgi:hypothetical protein
MTARSSPTLRWSEEAEAKHVLEWAELDCGVVNRGVQPDVSSGATDRQRRSASLSFWLRTLLRRNYFRNY